jgi:hypothetical protein
MSNPNILTPDSPTAAAGMPALPTTEPPFLARARRILAGDIRPEDYLPVADDIIAFVDGSEARTGIKLLPEYRQLLIDTHVLQEHHAGDIVLCRHTPDGVIVLAAGPNAVDDLSNDLTPDQQTLTTIEYPPTPLV